MRIPEKVYDFNAYDDKEKLIGVTGEVTLPNLEATTSTLSGAGILGEIESTNVGHFGSLTTELTFRTLAKKSFDFLSYSGRALILRGATQVINGGKAEYIGLKITMKWMPKGLELGKLAKNAETETKNTFEIFYIKIEEDGKTVLELDKLNYVFKVNGKDQLSGIKKLI